MSIRSPLKQCALPPPSVIFIPVFSRRLSSLRSRGFDQTFYGVCLVFVLRSEYKEISIYLVTKVCSFFCTKDAFISILASFSKAHRVMCLAPQAPTASILKTFLPRCPVLNSAVVVFRFNRECHHRKLLLLSRSKRCSCVSEILDQVACSVC